jgi:hypothetical protein
MGAAESRHGAPQGPRDDRGPVRDLPRPAPLADGAADDRAAGRRVVLPDHQADGRRVRRARAPSTPATRSPGARRGRSWAGRRRRGRPAAGWPSGRSMTSWWPRPSRMRGRVEGRGGNARADRPAGAGPDECAEDPHAHPVRPSPAGGHDPPDGEGQTRRPARAAPPRPLCRDAGVAGRRRRDLGRGGRRLPGPLMAARPARRGPPRREGTGAPPRRP